MGEYLTLVDTTNEEYIEIPSNKRKEIILNDFCQKMVTAFTLRNAHRDKASLCWVSDEYGPKEIHERYYDEYGNVTVEVLEYLFEDQWSPDSSRWDWILKQYEKSGDLEKVAERIPNWG